jgi:hypothetical protein
MAPLAIGLGTGFVVEGVLVSIGGMAGMLSDSNGSMGERAPRLVTAVTASSVGLAIGMWAELLGWPWVLGSLVAAAAVSAHVTIRHTPFAIAGLSLLVFTAIGTGATHLTTIPPWSAGLGVTLGGAIILAVPDLRSNPACTKAVVLRGQLGLPFAAGLIACIAVAGLISLALDPSHRYWVPLTVAFVFKPEIGPVPDRALHRMLGTLAGAGIGALLFATNPPGAILLACSGVLAGALPVTLGRHYGLFTACMTMLILIELSLVHRPAGDYFAAARVIDTASGCVIAVLGAMWLRRLERIQRPVRKSKLSDEALSRDEPRRRARKCVSQTAGKSSLPHQTNAKDNGMTRLMGSDRGLGPRAKRDIAGAIQAGRFQISDPDLAVEVAGGAQMGLSTSARPARA